MATRMGILLRVSSAVPAQIIAAVWGASVLSHGGKTQRWRTRPTRSIPPVRRHQLVDTVCVASSTQEVGLTSAGAFSTIVRYWRISSIDAEPSSPSEPDIVARIPLPEPHCPKSGHEFIHTFRMQSPLGFIFYHLAPYTVSPTDLVVRCSTWEGEGHKTNTHAYVTRTVCVDHIRKNTVTRKIVQLGVTVVFANGIQTPSSRDVRVLLGLVALPFQVECLAIRSVGDTVYGARCPVNSSRREQIPHSKNRKCLP